MAIDADVLTIQKFIYLLNDFHYAGFKSHLVKTNASLPLKLTETIKAALPGFDTHSQLCKKIYAGEGKTIKQNFNQLNSYTFKLSAWLAANYPGYLQPNIEKIQKLVADGKLPEANFCANCLLDIAERISDFTSQIFALKFLSQQFYLTKDTARALKTDRLLQDAITNQNLFFKIQSVLRNSVYNATTPMPGDELNELLQYLEKFDNHSCPAIRILGSFTLQQLVFTHTAQMYSSAQHERVKRLKKEILNYPYVVFSFLLDIKGSFDSLLLNSPYTNVFENETAKEYEKLSAHYDSIKFWKNYFNIGELNLIAIQGTQILSRNHYKLHRPDYLKIMAPDDRSLLSSLIARCDKIMHSAPNRKSIFEERSVRMLHGVLLTLSGPPDIERGINELEALLIDFQQISFKASTDSIFMCLMFGYFALKDYRKCALSFKRYVKSIKGKLSFDGNRIKIYSYYYLSQWLHTHSKQYPAKLEALLTEHGSDGSQRTIWDMVHYFQLPIKVPHEQLAALK